jgi:glycosyltransferase involved in cell wall biosynthesis
MPILSILIPSITQRTISHLLPLISHLESQINDLENPDDVELIVFMDNKRRSIGHKRQGALDLAKGLFIAYVDDDDMVDNLYVEKAIESIKANAYVDVITFKQWVILNDAPPISLTFQLGHEKYDEISDAFPIRPPFHVCFWRRGLVKDCTFPDLMYSEDSVWVEQANKLAKTSHHIDHHMMTYIFNSNVTQAL